ncbi:cytochrome c [Synechococcus sp. KORDI-100]|uniref:c-type cytochrome n=1 Tax=Synechococcus sp. KORDI-100 TaxID=1280380 RepID=UPI00057189CE|nr:cytochrome c [Synechococcus sp. KORDI-100]
MSEPTSTAVSQDDDAQVDGGRGLIAALVVLAAAACVVLLLWVLGNARQDPYLRATLELQGSVDHGGQLFRINCAGCHGLAGQGLLGPSLVGISQRSSDPRVVHQIVSGETPPMPSFQMEPSSMADLLAYLRTLR